VSLDRFLLLGPFFSLRVQGDTYFIWDSETRFHDFSRWLIDTGKESAGMQVIADLHGGDSNNPVALAEFEEIRDKVMEDVSRQYILI